jgi:hypothetical protein
MSLFFLYKTGEQESGTGPFLEGLAPVGGGGGGGERVWKGEYGANTMYSCMKMEK